MFLNIAALEAKEDVREYMLVGTIFNGGEGGQNYAEHLVETAWDSDPEIAVKVKRMMAASEANLGRPVKAPEEKQDGA